MTLANAHALFCGLKADPSYLANLAVPDAEQKALTGAKALIRSTIKEAAKLIQGRDEFWDESYSRQTRASNRLAIQIKFMTQGSFAYGTLNAPAQAPVQEIDLDDGMYVPVNFLENGTPALAAKGLFNFTEAALQPLCEIKGWELAEKDCCVRVKLWPGAHIDLPIYSIPEDRFQSLRESLAKSLTAGITHDSIKGTWKLPSDKIMLAHRDGRWVQSDPQQLHDWVQARAERYGPAYKRVTRFFKGWRDHSWVKSKLSSICLMRAIDIALEQMEGFPTENRDDELILELSKRLPKIFMNRIDNPVLRHLCINEWSADDRNEIVRGAELLRDEMMVALERTGDAEQVVLKIRRGFGNRIPYRPDAIKIGSKIAVVQSAPAAVVPAPRIISSTSG